MRQLAFVLFIVLSVTIACSPSGLPRDSPPDSAVPQKTGRATPPVKLTAAKVPALCFADWTVASRKRFFAEEGLDVELLPMDTTMKHDHSQGWVRGTSGGITRADLTIIEYHLLGDVLAGKLPYYIVAGEHSGCRQLVVPIRSTIRAISDLKGKRVGLPATHLGGIWEYLGRQTGLAPGSIRWINFPVAPGSVEELETVKHEFAVGRLDAYAASDPVGEILKAEGTVRLVASNTWTPPLRDWYCCMLAIRRDLVDGNPELPKAVTRAIRRSARFVEQNPVEAVALAIESGQLPTDTNRDLSARLLGEYVWASTGRLQDDLERYFQILIDIGKVDASVPPRELVKRVYRSGE